MATDLTIVLDDRPGELARVGELLGKHGVNIEGVCAVTSGGGDAEAYRTFVVDWAGRNERVFAACRARGIAFLETCTPENIVRKIDEGVGVIAGHREETARVGRAHTQRTMPV
jgi:hypothetical protein